jgi:hypothetical protein
MTLAAAAGNVGVLHAVSAVVLVTQATGRVCSVLLDTAVVAVM